MKRKLSEDHKEYLCDLLEKCCNRELPKEERESYDTQFHLRLYRLEKQGYDVVEYYDKYRWGKVL